MLGGGLPDGAAGADHRASWVFGLLDGLLESALFAQALRDDDGQVRDFRLGYLSGGFRDPAGRNRADLAGRPMLEVYPAAAMAGGLFDQAVQVLSTGEPCHIAGEIVSVFAGDATVSPVMEVRIARLFDGVVVSWRRADEVDRLSAHLQQASRLGRIGSWEENVLSGEVRWTEPAFALFGRPPGAPLPVAKLNTLVIDDDVPVVDRFRDMLLREKKQAAATFRVIRADDGSVRQMRAVAEPVTDPAGTLIAVRGAYQDVSADHHVHVAFAAAREQLADSEQRAEEERLLATRLQHAITPRTAAPVEAGGLNVAARYLPAGPPSLVCGDWYDAVMLPSKEVLLVVGDVAGHGIDAVTGMVALRNALRGLAMTGATPATLLGWLNAAACHLTDDIVGTALCGIYDPGTRTLHWARAGHLPPIVVRAGTAQPLELPHGVLLGADPAASYDQATTSLQPGDILLLYTDGLIERRDESLDKALHSLLRVASQSQPDIGLFADHLVAHSPANTLDDACLVAVQVH